MSDRKLLELAAKAAGIPLVRLEPETVWDTGHITRAGWNPLADDGDALRLAVKLRLSAYHAPQGWLLLMNPDGSTASRVDFGDESERLVATRRAITRAAAEIGKGMP
jgi:hypothetical protein